LIENVVARCYYKEVDIKGPIILNERPKKTPVRGPVPARPTAPGVIRVPYPSYDPSDLTQPKFMEFIPILRFPKK